MRSAPSFFLENSARMAACDGRWNSRRLSVEVVTTGRHDPCVGLRATPIAEAMLAIVLMDHYLRHRGQNADVVMPSPVIPAHT